MSLQTENPGAIPSTALQAFSGLATPNAQLHTSANLRSRQAGLARVSAGVGRGRFVFIQDSKGVGAGAGTTTTGF